MEKYLGNKTALLPLIGDFLADRVPDARSMSDLFTGTTNVSRFFRRAGFSIAAGDLNRFSYVLGRAYLTHERLPKFTDLQGRYDPTDLERLRFSAERTGPMAAAKLPWADLEPLSRAIARLQREGDANLRPGIIFGHFCRAGKNSEFRSIRGGGGRRNYFSEANALVLDGMLAALRRWRAQRSLSDCEMMMLLASVIEEVVITANVSGTFHDFSRDRLWPNANQRFTLRLPPAILAPQRAEVVNCDALEAGPGLTRHDVCYIDPPYNFRQYGAYYHLLNFVAAFPFLDDPEAYAAELGFVRGQNMRDDHSSSFCYKDDFVDSLRQLITAVPSTHVVLSYYGGRNHWNHWSATDEPTDQGLTELGALFRDRGLFDECEVVPALSVRRNYQSRVGERKSLVDEYLLLGSRTRVPAPSRGKASPLQANVAIGVDQHFGRFVAGGEEGAPGSRAPAVVNLAVS
jgi:adenine-specific DNA-methyltransferase